MHKPSFFKVNRLLEYHSWQWEKVYNHFQYRYCFNRRIRSLFQNNKVWSGYNEVDWFFTPKRELTRASGYWFTNIPIRNRPKYKQLKIIHLKDIPVRYKKYDDSKMLIVDIGYIPDDYKKSFGVSTRPILNGLLEKGYKIIQDKEYYPYINGKKRYSRVLVQKIL
jgi:hypothetical protein